MTMKTTSAGRLLPFYALCRVRKFRGGRRPLWHARLDETDAAPGVVGAGSTADLAIRDLQEQLRRLKARSLDPRKDL